MKKSVTRSNIATTNLIPTSTNAASDMMIERKIENVTEGLSVRQFTEDFN